MDSTTCNSHKNEGPAFKFARFEAISALSPYIPCTNSGKKLIVILPPIAYLLRQMHRFWCEGKPVLPSFRCIV